MKTLITAIAAALFATGVGAADVYQGLDRGNSDLSTVRTAAADRVGVQPGVGDSLDRYHGWADGNSDLFKIDRGGRTGSGTDPDILHGNAPKSPCVNMGGKR